MINIAGKRSSLAFLNHLLTNIPGVRDGVFCMPQDDEEHDTPRPAAFVVAPELNPADILAAMRLQVAPVFLPRPVIFIDHLQRDANGKIPAAVVKALIAEHITFKA